MARARGANALMALGYETTYGTPPGGNYRQLPFVSSNLGEEQGLIASDLLGYGRDPQSPSKDVINNDGDVVVPLDIRNFGDWLKLLFGAPTSTTGVAASGAYTFSDQPANNATITVAGQAFTFVSGTPAANQVKIGPTLADTIANAVVALNASAVAGVAAASYAASLDGTKILVTHDTIGTSGNSFTIAAGSSPASNASASASTLAGGSGSGPTNHVFVPGALSLPSGSIEVGMPDVPSYGMNFGACANTLAIPLQRSGLLNATIGLICQGETRGVNSGAGTPTQRGIERLAQFSGVIRRDGVPIGNLVSGNFNFSNGLDKVEVIRPDGRIAGADPGMLAVTGDMAVRFATTDLLDLAVAGTPVELVFEWSISAAKLLRITVHTVNLPKPKLPITGPAGVQASFAWQASEHPTLGKSATVTLINDVTGY